MNITDKKILDADEFKEKMTINIAGQDISYFDYERYMELVKPSTLRTLIKGVKTDEYARAIQNQMRPEVKKALIIITIIIAIVGIGMYIMWKVGLFEGGPIM